VWVIQEPLTLVEELVAAAALKVYMVHIQEELVDLELL
jgi:hypothetical protein